MNDKIVGSVLAIVAIVVALGAIWVSYKPTDRLTDGDVRSALSTLIDGPSPTFRRIAYRPEKSVVEYQILHPYVGWTVAQCQSHLLDGVVCRIDPRAYEGITPDKSRQNFADFNNRVPPPLY